jgi:hypothetical protein
MKRKLTILAILLALGFTQGADAVRLKDVALPDAIRIGAGGLVDLQNPDGSWGDSKTAGAVPVYRDSSVVLESLRTIGLSGDTALDDGVTFVGGLQESDNDVIARKIVGLIDSRIAVDNLRGRLLSESVDTVASVGGSSFSALGWPFETGASANILDTAISYRALLLSEADFSGNDHLDILTFLRGSQLNDGGWSFFGNDSGDVFISCLVLLAIVEAPNVNPSVHTDALTDGRVFLLGEQNTNGSWGEAPGQVAETALAGLALQRVSEVLGDDLARSAISAGGTWLRANQLIDGTWPRNPSDPPDLLDEGDAYESAVALLFLSSQNKLTPTPTPDPDAPTPTPTATPVVPTSTPRSTSTPTSTPLPKLTVDLNDDGKIDHIDLFLFSTSIGALSGGGLQGLNLDYDNDGEVTRYDTYTIMRNWHTGEGDL